MEVRELKLSAVIGISKLSKKSSIFNPFVNQRKASVCSIATFQSDLEVFEYPSRNHVHRASVSSNYRTSYAESTISRSHSRRVSRAPSVRSVAQHSRNVFRKATVDVVEDGTLNRPDDLPALPPIGQSSTGKAKAFLGITVKNNGINDLQKALQAVFDKGM